MSGVRLRVVGVVFVLAGVLAACSSDPKPPPFTPSPQPTTSSASPTPTPTPSRTGPLTTGPNVRPGEKPPVLTATAKQHTESGALAFATYFIKAEDWGIATTDPYLVKQISAATCKGCQRFIDRLTQLAAAGGHARGGRYTIDSLQIVHGTSPVKADVIVKFKLTQQALVRIYPSGAPSTDSAKPTSYTSYVFLSWRNGGWKIIEQGD